MSGPETRSGLDRPLVKAGMTVLVQTEEKDEFEYHIKDNPVKNLAPLAQALLHHRQGDEVEVHAPGGVYKVKIISITSA